MSNDRSDWIECWQCGGNGSLAGCFEDCCSGADCDPEDPDYCCSPRRCDICKGKGAYPPPAAPAAPTPSSSAPR